MKGRSVLLDRVAGRLVAAQVIDGRLDDLLVESDAPAPGTIYRAVVERPVKGAGGVFLRLEDGAAGFLRQAKGLGAGQRLLVQVRGYAEPGKAVPVAARLLFKSKYAIATPGAPGVNVSRRIREDGVRAALTALAGTPPEGIGLILRSDAAEAEPDAVAEDVQATLSLAARVVADTEGPAERLLDGPDPHGLAWRDWGHPDEVDRATGCLAARGLLEEIASLAHPAVPLPGGGSLWVEPTRALVACDVNTGADASPAAALKANLEAVRALPRALRLRGLGGQIAVDLAPLSKKDRRAVEQAAQAALRADPVETSLAGWTPLGHMEWQRARERAPLDPGFLREIA